MDLSNVSNQRRWTIVGLLFTASVINYLDRAAISFALPLISRDFHLTPETKGLLLSSFFWSYALMQVPIGWCADRFNLRWLYAGAFAIWSLAQGLTGLAESLAVLIGFRILLGVGESIYLPGGTKIVSVLFAAKDGLPFPLDFGTLRLVLKASCPLAPVRYGGVIRFFSWDLRVCLDHPMADFPPPVTGGRTRSFLSSISAPFRWRSVLSRVSTAIASIVCFCFDYTGNWSRATDYLVTVRHLSVVQAGLCIAAFHWSKGRFRMDGRQPIRRGWDETRTRKGIVTVPDGPADRSHAGFKHTDGDRPLIEPHWSGLPPAICSRSFSAAPPEKVGI
jgi:MFS family permease